MSKLRISVVEFLNTAPLVWGFTHGPLRGRYDLSFTVPSLCAEELRSGNVDVAIIPSVEYQRIPGMVMLPELAIAAKGEVRSILVLSRKPIENVRRIAMDTNSRSSVALTRLLCSGLWGIFPEFLDTADPVAMLREHNGGADAALVIGDPALRIRLKVDALAAKSAAFKSASAANGTVMSETPATSTAPGTVSRGSCGCGEAHGAAEAAYHNDLQPVPGVNTLFVYDVAEQWRKMTGKPCVLAVWVGRREAVTPQVAADFLASQQYGLAHIAEISEDAALKLNLPPRNLELYLRDNINFSLDAENLDGLQHFFQLCAGAGLIPQARAINFVPVPERAAVHAARAQETR